MPEETEKECIVMEIIGKWKIDEVQKYSFTDAGPKKTWQKAADVLADESVDEDEKQMLRADVVFTADGKVQWCIPIPAGVTQEQINEALASGELKMTDDGKMVVEEKAWKEEDGKLLYDTGAKGEVMGEEISPWVELREADGAIEIMVYRLVRA